MSEARHPEPELLERFMRCELPRSEAPAVVRHLLTGCPRCLKVTRAAYRQVLRVEEEARRGRSAASGKLRLRIPWMPGRGH